MVQTNHGRNLTDPALHACRREQAQVPFGQLNGFFINVGADDPADRVPMQVGDNADGISCTAAWVEDRAGTVGGSPPVQAALVDLARQADRERRMTRQAVKHIAACQILIIAAFGRKSIFHANLSIP